MRKVCPRFDGEDGLETVLEVPMPEEMFGSCNKNAAWQNVKSYLTIPSDNNRTSIVGSRNAEIQVLLGILGAPLIPLPVDSSRRLHQSVSDVIRTQSIEAAAAKYILKQYIASVGGETALSSIASMYAMGKVKMGVSEFCVRKKSTRHKRKKKSVGGGEMGGFVMWQKGPELWSLEMAVSGIKIIAGSDGKVAWRQTPWNVYSHSSAGAPRPLRRFLQGLDPRSTANLFANSIWVEDKPINGEDCFVLKLEIEPSTLKSRSNNPVEVRRHTILGCFSQRSGLLVHLEDSQLLRVAIPNEDNTFFWETTTETLIQDYRQVDGVQIAHKGKTCVSLFRFEENSEKNRWRTRMEEDWEIEEVGFNVKGLSMDCFMAPGDLNNGVEEGGGEEGGEEKKRFAFGNCTKVLPPRFKIGSLGVGSAKVTAVDDYM